MSHPRKSQPQSPDPATDPATTTDDVAAIPGPEANGQAAENGQAGCPPRAAVDFYDLDSLRLSQDFASAVGLKRLLLVVPVRKPSKEWFIRTHPDPDYRLQTAVLELKEDRETYLVAPPLWEALRTEPTFSSRLLITAINRQGSPFIWPLRLPKSDGKADLWTQSAMDAADVGTSQWIRVAANMNLGAYDVITASARVAEPTWPDETFQQILKIAFRDRMIDTRDHPVLRRLRGEV